MTDKDMFKGTTYSSLEEQVGGKHYKNFRIQPADEDHSKGCEVFEVFHDGFCNSLRNPTTPSCFKKVKRSITSIKLSLQVPLETWRLICIYVFSTVIVVFGDIV